MPQKYTQTRIQAPAEPSPLASGWSKAEFLALERRWSFLERLGGGKADAEGMDRI